MAIPDRPVAGAAIETEWGQAVHDYTFAPSGCKVHSSSGGSVGTTVSKMNLDVVDDDPGGYLDAAHDRIIIPADREGLYQIFIQGNTVNGSAGDGFQTRFHLSVNGVFVSNGIEDNNAAVNVTVVVVWIGDLVAGDIIEAYGQRRGAGSNPTISVTALTMYRIGSELGA